MFNTLIKSYLYIVSRVAFFTPTSAPSATEVQHPALWTLSEPP